MGENTANNGSHNDDVFLIELEGGEHPRYVVAEAFMTIDPHHNALDVAWSVLDDLFKGQVLRAVPVPARLVGRPGDGARGVSTGPGKVEVNVNIGKRP